MASSGSSRLPDRGRELLGAVPWRSLLVDLCVVVAWVAVASLVFRAAGWSVLAYYAVVFGGVLAYSLAGPRVARRVRR